nr:MAG TPA_asm: hypothetical protein [Bacteriophage sp.]
MFSMNNRTMQIYINISKGTTFTSIEYHYR